MSRRNDLLFHAGGECVEQYGTIVRKTLRDDDHGYTHTRSGTVGPSVGFDGVIRSAAANIPRVDWEDGDAYLLLEAARTNLVTEDDVSAWGDGGGNIVTSSVADPAGGTGAYTITGDGDTSEQRVESVTFTGDAVKSACFVVKEATMPASGDQRLAVSDTTSGLDRLALDITAWSSGEPTITETAGTLLGSRYIGNGFWAVYGQTTSVTAANAHLIRVYSNVAASAGAITVYRVNAFDSTVPSFSILDASETRNADTFYADFVHPPQAMTVYAKFIERGTVTALAGLLQIGGPSTGADPRFVCDVSGGKYRVTHDNGTVTSQATLAAGPSFGDVVEIRLTLNADGSVEIGQSINSAVETTATDATASTLGSAWANPRLYINSEATSVTGINSFRSVKVARGIKTMNEMRGL